MILKKSYFLTSVMSPINNSYTYFRGLTKTLFNDINIHMNCFDCIHNNDCQYLNSDTGDLRFLLRDECDFYRASIHSPNQHNTSVTLTSPLKEKTQSL